MEWKRFAMVPAMAVALAACGGEAEEAEVGEGLGENEAVVEGAAPAAEVPAAAPTFDPALDVDRDGMLDPEEGTGDADADGVLDRDEVYPAVDERPGAARPASLASGARRPAFSPKADRPTLTPSRTPRAPSHRRHARFLTDAMFHGRVSGSLRLSATPPAVAPAPRSGRTAPG